MMFLKKLKSRNINVEDFLLVLAFLISTLTVLYSIFTFGRANIHSDTAVLADYVNCLLKEKSIYPKDWNYVNGEIWGLNMFWLSLGQVLFCFIKNLAVRRMCASAFQLILGYAAVYLLSKKVFNNKSWMLTCPLVSLFLWGASDLLLYQAAYTSFLIFHPLIFMLVLFFYNPEKKKWSLPPVILYSMVIVLLCMGGIRSYAEYVLPLIIATIISFLLNQTEKIRNEISICGIKMLIIMIPALEGSIVYKWLCTWHELNNVDKVGMVFPESIDEVLKGIIGTVLNHFECFGYKGSVLLFSIDGFRNLVSITICILVCIIVPILQMKRVEYENREVIFFFYVVIAHNLIIFVFSSLMSFTSYYHVLGNVILFSILSARYIYEYWIKSIDPRIKILWSLLFLLAVCISSLGLYKVSDDWRTTLTKKEKINNELLARNLHKGYATFWNAYANEIYSNGEIKYCGIKIANERLQLYSWLTDNSRFLPEDEKTFVMLTSEEREGINDRILYGYDVPVDEFIIEDVLFMENSKQKNTDLYVFVYENDYAKNIVNYLDDGVLDAREMSFNHYGIRDDHIVTMTIGGMVFGPYDALEKGQYLVTIKGSNLNNCTFDIYSENTPQLVQYKLISADEYKYSFQLDLSNRVDDIQFQIANEGLMNTDNVEFLRIELEKNN